MSVFLYSREEATRLPCILKTQKSLQEEMAIPICMLFIVDYTTFQVAISG